MFPETPAASHALPGPAFGLALNPHSKTIAQSHKNKDVRSRSELGRPLIIVKGIHGNNL